MSSIVKSLAHPSEIAAMFKLKFGGLMPKESRIPLDEQAKSLTSREFCYAVLNKVSRSFAVVINQLPEELRDCVCIFYLALRGLDSVEDDMTFPLKEKLPMLLDFHNLLEQKGWKIAGVGDGPDYRVLMANFDRVIDVYLGLKPEYRAAIKDITKRMGAGMADFATKTGEGVATVEAYNLYCHYVAGLVGHGLSALFSASGLEDSTLVNEKRISNSMGLFLQKTNIIRDYKEDIEQGRTWWPKEIWGEYGASLEEFGKNPTSYSSMSCLNHMVTDALELVPDCLEYLARLKTRKVFEFCAIPQVMAIATLAEVYNNPNVFTKVVKIRKGLSCKMMLDSFNLTNVHKYFAKFARKIQEKIPRKDPFAKRTNELCQQVLNLCNAKATVNSAALSIASVVAWVGFVLSVVYLANRWRQRHADVALLGPSPMRLNGNDLAAIAGVVLSLGYILGFFGIFLISAMDNDAAASAAAAKNKKLAAASPAAAAAAATDSGRTSPRTGSPQQASRRRTAAAAAAPVESKE